MEQSKAEYLQSLTDTEFEAILKLCADESVRRTERIMKECSALLETLKNDMAS